MLEVNITLAALAESFLSSFTDTWSISVKGGM